MSGAGASRWRQAACSTGASMPMIAFFPWAVLDEPVVAGEFTVAPFSYAATLMPRDHALAVREVIAAYDKSDNDVIAQVPVLFRTAACPTDDVPEEALGALFQHGEVIAFAALSARAFFMDPYWNRDSLRLVVQGFRPDRPGGALITSRRRDGSVNAYVPAAHHQVRRPVHVSHAPLDRLDVPLLTAVLAACDDAGFPRVIDAIRGYNAANTDSPDIGQEAELIMLIGAYSRLFGVWDKVDTAAALRHVLTGAPEWFGSKLGPKWELQPLRDKLAKSKSKKFEWMADAYLLRGQFAHGHGISPYKAIWGLRDHLLLGSYLFPLTVKAWLAGIGRYTLRPTELMQIAAFDALASFDHFEMHEDEDGDYRRPSDFPWVRVIQSIPLQLFLTDMGGRSGSQPGGPAAAAPEA